MDEDTIFALFFLGFIFFVFTSPLWITACIAAAATRSWSKKKARWAYGDAGSVEADRLVEEDNEVEEDFLDSEDEEYYSAKREQKRKEREEEEADRLLTPRAKFLKEWKKCWTGGNKAKLDRERELREQDERRKIAREAVREYLRLQKRKTRRASSKSETSSELPSYNKATKA